jgi:cell wall-associated NlpC family hydrolase
VAQPAAADQQYPNTAQLQQASDAASAKAAQVRQIQTALAAETAVLAADQLAAEQAAEAYDAAQIQLAQRSAAATLADSNATAAAAAQQQAQAAVGRLAAQTYQDGGSPSLASAVFASNGLQDLLDRSTMLTVLSDVRIRTMQQMNSTQLFASWLQQQADAALLKQQDATTVLDQAQQKAAQTAGSASAAMAATRVQQQQLVAQLTSLQKTSTDLQAQRQAALALQAAARAAQQAPSVGAGPPPSTGTDSSGPSGSVTGTADGGLTAVAWARQQLGLPYQWGGAGPDSYDCSGLTMRAWQQAGVILPHYAASQYALSGHVAYGSMRPGDLIFYATDTNDPSTIHHVTLYAGGGMMIEAPYTGADVRIVPLRWDGAMPWAGRP